MTSLRRKYEEETKKKFGEEHCVNLAEVWLHGEKPIESLHFNKDYTLWLEQELVREKTK